MIKQASRKHLVAEGAELLNRQLEIVEEQVELASGEEGWVFYVKDFKEGEGVFIAQEHLDNGSLTKKDAYNSLAAAYEFLADPC